MKMLRKLTLLLVLLAAPMGCSADISGEPLGGDDDPGNNPDDPGGGPGTVDTGRKYTGFEGLSLTEDRADGLAGADRTRLKPFSVLLTEYPRVLGSTPAALNRSRNTFADVAAPWYVEPLASAQTAYAALTVAFEGCLTLTSNEAKYGTAPTMETATVECTSFARKFWSRTPDAVEVGECVAAALTDSAAETNARRKWAYTCASVLTSAGFLTY